MKNRAVVRPVFVPDRVVTNVGLISEQGSELYERYFVLKYKGWPVDSTGRFEKQLKGLLPSGTRWYGRFLKVSPSWRYWCSAGGECVDDISGSEGDNCRFCVEVLLDFGGVDEVTTLDCRKSCFNIGGVSPQVEECAEVTKNDETFRCAYELQQEIASFLDVGEVFKECFGDILLEEVVDDSRSDDGSNNE